jgi:methionyl aminopeptidase
MSLMIVKNKKSIHKMRVAGKILFDILTQVKKFIVPGVTTLKLNDFIEQQMSMEGLELSCKGYAGYKHATCISLNDEVVHGVPSKNVVLKNGDFVKIDVVGAYGGYCVDIARYYFVGEVSEEVKRIAFTVQEALDSAIKIIRAGIQVGDISAYIQSAVEKDGFGVVRDFAGHGIGKDLHEFPEIPNYGKKGTGPVLQQGMTLAIEPMIVQWNYAIVKMEDGWTTKTKDGGISAHVEDTVLVMNDGCEVLTRP